MPTVNTDKLLRPSQASKIIGVSTRRVIVLCNEKRIGFKIGNQFYIPEDQAKKFKPNPPGRPKTEKRPKKSAKKRG